MIDEHRYRQAIEFAHNAEKEIKRLRFELAEQKQATESMTIIAEEAMKALEDIAAKNYTTRVARKDLN